MNLGETIYQLRTKQNLSQGDLAERLNLSRQSVSKWENNSAVPDLDNLVKLSEIFGVSLDTLVKGTTEEPLNNSSDTSVMQTLPSSQGMPMQKIIGLLLLCMSFISFLLITISFGLLSGMIIGAPFLALGILCLVFKKHAGLACVWVIYVCFDLFLRLGAGAGWSAIFAFSRYHESDLRWVFIIAWILFLLLITLLILTVRICQKKKGSADKKSKNKMLVLWSLFAIAFASHVLFSSDVVYNFLLDGHRGSIDLWHFLCSLLDYCRIFLIAAALVQTFRYRTAKKAQ